MIRENFFKRIANNPRLKSYAFLSPFWWSLSQRFYPGVAFGFFIIIIPFFGLALFFYLLFQIKELGFEEIRPFILSEAAWPIIIIFLSLYYRDYIFNEARKERKDKKPSSSRLALLRIGVALKFLLLVAAIPFIMSFLLRIEPDLVWIQKYLELGPLGLLLEIVR